MGTWDVDGLLAQMSASEMAGWEWFLQLEPHGAFAEDLRFGQVCAVLANINRTKNSKSYSPYDFLPTVDFKKPEQSAEDMFNALKGVMGGS